MRRFILGWKVPCHARRFGAEIANYADDFVVCGRAPAEAMQAAVRWMMERLRLPVNTRKTRCLRVPEEPMESLGCRVECNYRRDTGREYLGTRPSAGTARGTCRKISESTQARYGRLEEGEIVERLNPAMLGWANYFSLGQVDPTYAATYAHATKRLRQWLCRKHEVKAGKYAPFGRVPVAVHGPHVPERAVGQLRVGEGLISNESRVREVRTLSSMNGERNVVKVETEAPALWRKPPETATPSTLDERAAPRLYTLRLGARMAWLAP